jgi:hypothetical protein
MHTYRSFAACYAAGLEWKPHLVKASLRSDDTAYERPTGDFHPGFALAFRRHTYDKLGLLTGAAVGAGDHHMMTSFIGKADWSFPRNVHPNYRRMVLDYQARALEVVKKDLGYVHGTITHAFHGSKRSRAYISRWDVLVNNNFDPSSDVYLNGYGIPEIRSDRIALRDGIRKYHLSRNEDSTEM